MKRTEEFPRMKFESVPERSNAGQPSQAEAAVVTGMSGPRWRRCRFLLGLPRR